MTSELTTYQLEVPANCLGVVMGEITKRGGWLDDPSKESNKMVLVAKAARKDMLGFEEWFNKVSGGKGVFKVTAQKVITKREISFI